MPPENCVIKSLEDDHDKVRPEEKAMPAIFRPFILQSGRGSQAQRLLPIS
jgi:hypothetical protein